MFVTKKRYNDLYTEYKRMLNNNVELVQIICDSDEYIKELEEKLTKKKVAKKATKKVSK